MSASVRIDATAPLDAPTRIRRTFASLGSGPRSFRDLINDLELVAEDLEVLATLERFDADANEDGEDKSDLKTKDVTPARRTIDGDLDDAAEIVAGIADALAALRLEMDWD